MIIGENDYFCNCLWSRPTEHITVPDKHGCCVYCGYHAIHREVVDADIRCEEKHGDELNRLKREYLEVIIKDLRHNEKVN